MWEAFRGYRDVYGRQPPARKVRRVTLYLMARNEYLNELEDERQRDLEESQRQQRQ